jgi:hypothetical protein
MRVNFVLLFLVCIFGLSSSLTTTCTDDDSDNIMNQGTATMLVYNNDQLTDTYHFKDLCPDTARVMEFSCKNDGADPTAKVITCPDGYRCSDGACVTGSEGFTDISPTLYYTTPIDSDRGSEDIYTKGYTLQTSEHGAGIQFDFCMQDMLMEQTYGREHGAAGYKVVDCGENYYCFDDACTLNTSAPATGTSCEENDGYGYMGKGSVVVDNNGNITEFHDSCYDSEWVIDYICSPKGAVAVAERRQCPERFTCSDGACIKKPDSEITQSCVGPKDDSEIYTQNTQTYSLMGITSSYKDFCSNSSLYVKLWCDGDIARITPGECPSDYSCSEGACIPELGDKTYILIFSWLFQTDGSKDFSGGNGIEEGYALLEAKSDYKGFSFKDMVVRLGDEDFYLLIENGDTAKLWANNGNGGLVDLGKKNIRDVTNAPESGYEISGIPVVLGHVYAVKTQDGSNYGLIKPYMFEVRNITNGRSFCKDTEQGKDIYKKGYVTVGHLNGQSTTVDSCIDKTTVGEHICAGFAHSVPYLKNCPSGFVCSDGACVENTQSEPSVQCSDTDAYDVFTKGAVEEIQGSSKQNKVDYCTNAYRLVEYFCPSSTSSLSSKEISCGDGYYCSDGACKRNIKTCTDSVGRQDIDGRNEAHVTDFGHSYIYGDSCMDDYIARKYWCSGNELNSEDIKCPADSVCKYGRCKEPPAGNYSDLTIQLNPAAYWKVINLKDVYGNILKRGITTENGSITLRILEGQVFYIHSSQGYSDLWKAKQGHNPKIYKFVNKSGVPVLWSLGTDNGMLIPFGIRMYLDIAESISCIDNDGFDPYQSSYVRFQSNAMSEAQDFKDFCIDDQTLIEQLCNDTTISFKAYDCSSDYHCDKGACIENDADKSPSYAMRVSDIYVYPGWNMFSIPTTADNVTSDCNGFDTNSVWMYNSFSGTYTHPTNIIPGTGYWFHSKEKCRIRVRGTSISPADIFLQKGWNLIGSAPLVHSFDDIKGTCDFIKGPYSFNTGSQSYQLATDMLSGKAYFIKVDGPCYFSVEKNPPAPPGVSP